MKINRNIFRVSKREFLTRFSKGWRIGLIIGTTVGLFSTILH